MLRVREVAAHYGRLAAIRGVSLGVDEGEVVCVVGPNGAGKSTLLATIAGVHKATEGAIEFCDESITRLPPEEVTRQGIAFIPEGRHIFASLSVEENLLLGQTIHKPGAESRRDFDRVVRYFPFMQERLGSTAGKLSGGEQQQLAIGRGLLCRPRLMLIDEPSLGLAPMMVDRVYEILERLREEEGLTLLIVEQSAVRVMDIADRVYVMRDGRFELSGTPAEIEGGGKLLDAYFGYKRERVASSQ